MPGEGPFHSDTVWNRCASLGVAGLWPGAENNRMCVASKPLPPLEYDRMPSPIPDIVRALSSLPPDRIDEVYDFVLFLKTRHPAGVDQSDEWTEEDVQDVTNASLRYAADTLLVEEARNDQAG
jgi:hypothetical protein